MNAQEIARIAGPALLFGGLIVTVLLGAVGHAIALVGVFGVGYGMGVIDAHTDHRAVRAITWTREKARIVRAVFSRPGDAS